VTPARPNSCAIRDARDVVDDARVVDEHVHRAERARDLGGRALDRREIRNVDLHRVRTPAERARPPRWAFPRLRPRSRARRP
jgi:hypothetical protein